MKKSDIPIVFVPALLGTELIRTHEAENNSHQVEEELVYVTSAIGLNLKSPDISLPIKWTHDIEDPDSLPVQEKDNIVPGNVMETIQFCCCTVLNQYKDFCDHYRRMASKSFYTFEYDWRRDLNETTNKFVSYLKDICARHSCAPQVVSHSMGCLIALAAFKSDPSLFHSVIFAGGNFGGGAGFYPTNTDGMTVGLNKTFLRGDICYTFPSLYAGASPTGIGNDPILRDEYGHQLFQFIDSKSVKGGDKVSVDIDMYDVDHWKKFKLGPWSQSATNTVTPEMELHVKTCLNLGKHFQMKLRHNEPNRHSYPPVAVLVGDQYLNPDYFLWDTNRSCWIEWSPHIIKEFKPENYVRTDGTISYISASQPPLFPGVNIKEYKARFNGPGKGSHRELLDDVELIDKILEDLRLASSSEI